MTLECQRESGTLLNSAGKPAADTDHRALMLSGARLIHDRGGEEFERHRPKRHDHLLEINAFFNEERKATTGKVATRDGPKVSLAWQPAIAEGRQKLKTFKRLPVTSAMVAFVALRRGRFARSQPLRFNQLVNEFVEACVCGGRKDIVHA